MVRNWLKKSSFLCNEKQIIYKNWFMIKTYSVYVWKLRYSTIQYTFNGINLEMRLNFEVVGVKSDLENLKLLFIYIIIWYCVSLL